MDEEQTTELVSSSSDEEILAVCLAAAHCASEKPVYTGSRPGRAPNRDLGVNDASKQLDKDFFCRLAPGQPLYTEAEFERKFRIPRELYESLRLRIVETDTFFLPKQDAAGRSGGSTDLKIYAAVLMLSEGRTGFSVSRETRMSERQVEKCTKRFVRAVVDSLEEEWLRLPRNEELLEIEERYRSLGFPGCIGCVDCAGWDWDNCPVEWQGLYKGKEKKPVLRMEVFCDDNLRIWNLNFGTPGSKNDRTIMEHSPFFHSIRNGQWPGARPVLCVSGHQVKRFYKLVDGIYPRLSIFALPLADPRTGKEKCYSARHNSARKAVERVFGVLFRQFRVLYEPCRLWHLEDIHYVVKACAILHNMIADARGYQGTMRFRNELDGEEQARPVDLEAVMTSECRYEQAELWRQYVDEMDSPDEFTGLQKALIDHIWNMAGEEA